MRAIVTLTACVALAACGNATDADAPAQTDTIATAPTGVEPVEEEGEAVQEGALELTSTGLVAGDTTIAFEATRSEVEKTLEALLGPHVDRGDMAECGAGPMASTRYPGGVTVNFQDAKFVGWFWREPADGEAPAPVEVSTTGGRKLGDAQGVVESAEGFEMFEDSTLGEEFMIGDDFGGMFEDGKVSSLYTGTQCFFR